MKRHVFDEATGGKLLRVEDAEPQCGEDFCDTCGDCLHCYAGVSCIQDGERKGEHFWVVYEASSGGAKGESDGEG